MSEPVLSGLDFDAIVAAVEEAPVRDLIGYVARQRGADPRLSELPLHLAWPILLGGFSAEAIHAAGEARRTGATARTDGYYLDVEL